MELSTPHSGSDPTRAYPQLQSRRALAWPAARQLGEFRNHHIVRPKEGTEWGIALGELRVPPPVDDEPYILSLPAELHIVVVEGA